MRNHKIKTLSLLVSSALLSNAQAEVEISPSISTQYVKQAIVNTDNNSVFSADNFVLENGVLIDYDLPRLEGLLNFGHNHIQRSAEGVSSTTNYLDYDLTNDLEVIEGTLFFDFDFERSFRSADVVDFLTDDFLFNPENLIETSTQQTGVRIEMNDLSYFEFDSSAVFAKTKTNADEIADDTDFVDFEVEQINVELDLSTRPQLTFVNFELTGDASEQRREENGNFEQVEAFTILGVPITNDVEVFTTAFYEDNSIQFDGLPADQALTELYSYGMGLGWTPTRTRSLRIGANRSNRPVEEGGSENFISLLIDWSLTPLTSLNANFSRRAFGDSADVELEHSNRRWQNSLAYSESITTNAEFLNPLDIELNDDDFLPDIDDDQVLVPNDENFFNLNDNVVFRKSGILTTAYSKRRLNASVRLSRFEDEDLEESSFTTTDLITIEASFRLGRRTLLRSSFAHSRGDRESAIDPSDIEITQARFGFQRFIGRRLSASIEYSYLERQGEGFFTGGATTVGALNGPITDSRIALTMTYRFFDPEEDEE